MFSVKYGLLLSLLSWLTFPTKRWLACVNCRNQYTSASKEYNKWKFKVTSGYRLVPFGMKKFVGLCNFYYGRPKSALSACCVSANMTSLADNSGNSVVRLVNAEIACLHFTHGTTFWKHQDTFHPIWRRLLVFSTNRRSLDDTMVFCHLMLPRYLHPRSSTILWFVLLSLRSPISACFHCAEPDEMYYDACHFFFDLPLSLSRCLAVKRLVYLSLSEPL